MSKEKQLSDLALCKGFESGGGSGRFGRVQPCALAKVLGFGNLFCKLGEK